MAPLRLISRIVYGPIKSRRLGVSLGINLSPTTYKLCSFNCVYCHCGWTQVHTAEVTPQTDGLPTPDALRKELEAALASHPELSYVHMNREGKFVRESNPSPHPQLNYITFSGNGEPTLHPQFDEIVDIITGLRDKYAPQAKVALLTNSSMVANDKVRRALGKLDQRIMKLDAGTVEAFRRVNRPCKAVDFQALVEGLKGVEKVTIQTLLTGGRFHNVEEPEIEAWIEKLAEIRPMEVQIYSIDRPPADESLQKVPPEELKKIALRVQQATGVPVEVY